jgi:hypothetical protein
MIGAELLLGLISSVQASNAFYGTAPLEIRELT